MGEFMENRYLLAWLFLLGSGFFLFFQFIYPYHLFFKEQIQLFLSTPGYFYSLIEKPAGFSRYIGEFFTQFFYLRGGGPFVISLLLLIYFLVVHNVLTTFFQKSSFISILALIPVFAEFLMHTNVEYYLGSTVALVFTLVIFLVYSRINQSLIAKVTGVVFLPLVYWVAGVHVIFFLFLVLFYRSRLRSSFGFFEIFLVFFTILIPVLGRSIFTLTLKEAFLLPYFNYSYLVGVLLFLLTIPIGMLLVPFYSSHKTIVTSITWVLLLGSLIGGVFYYPNYGREKILEIGSEAYFGNWDKVYAKAEAYDDKNSIVSYYANIALARQDKLPTELLDFYQPFTKSLFLDVSPESDKISVFYSGDVFYELGDMNLAQHSSMLGKIFSSKSRSSRMVRQLAKINLIIGEIEAARKYLRMLEKTLFHDKWAEDLLGRIENSEPLPPYLLRKRNYLPARDTLRKGGEYVSGLEVLVESNSENSMALDYLLCYHLLSKNLQAFKKAFDKYYDIETFGMPRLYSEALLIIQASEKSDFKELREKKIRPEIINDFFKYTRLYESGGGYSEKLKKNYQNTYWFYFHFAKPTST